MRVPAGARPITLKDLAVHGSGLPRLPTNLNVARVRFEADASGAWSRLRLDRNGRTTRATR